MSSIIIVIFIDLIAIISSQDTLHWFLFPLSIYAVLILPDIIRWLCGRYDPFDPVGIFAGLSFYYFFLHPILWVMLDIKTPSFPDLLDWRPWFGLMGWLNVVGILGYKAGMKVGSRKRPKRTVYMINWKVFFPGVLLLIGLGLLSWTLLMSGYGWHTGLSELYTQSRSFGKIEIRSIFAGSGTFAPFASSLPAIVLIIVIHHWWQREKPITWLGVAILFMVFTGSLVTFNPHLLFGSRNSLFFPSVKAIGIIHFTIKKFGRKALALVMILLIGSVYLWGFYKALGLKSLEYLALKDLGTLEEKSRRNISFLMFQDLGLMSTQAYLAYRLVEYPENYSPMWGTTYPAAVVYMAIPRQLWPDKPLAPIEFEVGTDLMYGEGFYRQHGSSSKYYGLTGEAMLNFHFFGVPFLYWCLGLLTGWYRRIFLNLHPHDVRRLIAPLLSIALARGFIGNLSNFLSNFSLSGDIVIVLLVLISARKVSQGSTEVPTLAREST